MMRLVTWVLGLLLLWGLYWVGAGWALHTGVTRWFAAQEARGWQATYGALSLSGFPARHTTRIETPALADPVSGAAWRADWVALESRAVWPGHVTVRFADTTQRLSYFDQTLAVTAQGLSTDLRLRPGTALEVERLALSSGPWSMAQDGAVLLSADSLSIAQTQQDRAETYRIGLEAQRLTPGARLREMARVSRSLPESFEALRADLTVRFDTRWDRRALEQARPQPRQIDLHLAEAQWGPLRLSAAGAVDVDETGLPYGVVTIRAENWREMLEIAEASGALPPEARRAAEQTLGFLAGLGGTANALDLQLNLRNGFVALGPIPLGPAPRLILR